MGLAIAGCFFPPLELAAGASFEAALASSASTAFVLADVSMAAGVVVDTGVAVVHPTPANQAVVVGSQVLVGYEQGLAEFPVVLGNLFHPQNPQQASYSPPKTTLRACKRLVAISS